MEAATPLHTPRIHVLANAVLVERLAIHDERAVALVRARSEAGEDLPALISEALEIGARVLDREQAEANAEWMRAEFEKASREVEASFAEKARAVAEFFDKRVDQVFGPENGQLAKELARLFGDGSSEAVQHQLRQVMGEAAGRMREDLLKQFSSADGTNPLADFKAGTMAAMRRAAEQQDLNLKAMGEQLAGAAARGRRSCRPRRRSSPRSPPSTSARRRRAARTRRRCSRRSTRSPRAQGDDCDAVGDQLGTGGRKGDVLIGLDGCAGPPRGRIVIEAKTRPGRPQARARGARRGDGPARRAVRHLGRPVGRPAAGQDVASCARSTATRLFVVYDPEDGSRLMLEVAYKLARARVLMARGETGAVDAGALQTEVERALMRARGRSPHQGRS